MSVRIFGSGGGVITDATAIPEDVVSGRIFYNNNGRQVGTNPQKRLYSKGSVSPTGYLDPLNYKSSFKYGTYGGGILTGYSSTYKLAPLIGVPGINDFTSAQWITPLWSIEMNIPLEKLYSINGTRASLTDTGSVNIAIEAHAAGYEAYSNHSPSDTSRSMYLCLVISDSILQRILLCMKRGSDKLLSNGGYIKTGISVSCHYTE